MNEYLPDYRFVVINIIIMMVQFVTYKDEYRYRTSYISDNYFYIALSLMAYSVFAFAELDTYSYHRIYDEMRYTHSKIHVESFYFWLAQNITNYYLWRFIIWGLATFFLIKSLKCFEIDSNTAGLIIPIFIYYQFALTRGSLGLSLMLFALAYTGNRPTNHKYWLISIIALIICVQLHRSIIVFMLLIPVAYFIPFSKKFIWISILLFPFLYKIISIVPSLLIESIAFSEDVKSMGELYLGQDASEINTNGLLRIIYNLSGVLLTLTLTTKYMIEQREEISPSLIFLQKYGFILVYISFLFLGQPMANFISSRTLHAASFPLLITTCFYYQSVERTRSNKLALFLLGSYTFLFNVCYYFYLWHH
ncbi:MAG: EpsG family protein [Paludibacteraceae bacterium]|nr:EpsG family protein [Paludibacteraceae bacterium]